MKDDFFYLYFLGYRSRYREMMILILSKILDFNMSRIFSEVIVWFWLLEFVQGWI